MLNDSSEILVQNHFFDPKTRSVFSAKIPLIDQQRMQNDLEYSKIVYEKALKEHYEKLNNPPSKNLNSKRPIQNSKLNLNEKLSNNLQARTNVWSYTQTNSLINSFKSHINEYHHSMRAAQFWKNVSNDLINEGYQNATPKKCYSKWITLIRSYNQCKNRSDQETIRFKFFKEIDEILKYQPQNLNKIKTKPVQKLKINFLNTNEVKSLTQNRTNDNQVYENKKLKLISEMIEVQEKKLMIYEKQCSLLEKYFKTIKAK